MPARIVLVRHGLSAHVHTAGAVGRAGMEAWRAAYDAAGIHARSQPPDALIRIAAEADHVVASDLARAVESARRLAPSREIRTTELLRETPLHIPAWPTRLPLGGWGFVITLDWGWRIARGRDASAEERARAAAAVEWLAALAANESIVLAVTHGAVRRLLANRLLSAGWSRAGRVGGWRPWSAWSFISPTPGFQSPDA